MKINHFVRIIITLKSVMNFRNILIFMILMAGNIYAAEADSIKDTHSQVVSVNANTGKSVGGSPATDSKYEMKNQNSNWNEIVS